MIAPSRHLYTGAGFFGVSGVLSPCSPGLLFLDNYNSISSAHQSTEPGSALGGQKLVDSEACSVDERVDTQVDESDQSERVVHGCRTERLQTAQLAHQHKLERQPTEREARNDDYHRLDDVLLRLAERLRVTAGSSGRG